MDFCDTAVFVNSGPSLDRLSPLAWRHIQNAAEVIAVNGALVAEACLCHNVHFTCAVAMDAGTGPKRGLGDKVPMFATAWASTAAWRMTKVAPGEVEAETFVRLVVGQWCNNAGEGYAGGGSAAGACNWFANDWPHDPGGVADLQQVARAVEKRIPGRGFRKFAFFGLDMIPGRGGHARGAGEHQSGFVSSPQRDQCLRQRWSTLNEAAASRGIELVNWSPGTGLREMPYREPPSDWLLY